MGFPFRLICKFLFIFLHLMIAGCMPAKVRHLDAAKLEDPLKAESSSEETAQVSSSSIEKRSSKPAPMQQLDTNLYQVRSSKNLVLEAVITVLMKNYNIQLLDRESGVITTEWDSFSKEGITFRNKLSVRIKQVSRSEVEVSLFNNVERLYSDSESVGMVWLPSVEASGETDRLAHNVALALGIEPPQHLKNIADRSSLQSH